MQFLVRVDGPGDVLPFKRAMASSGVKVSSSYYDKDWVDSLVSGPQPHDAEYLFVEAQTESEIDDALDAAARASKWVNGRPEFSVLGSREPPSYSA